MPTLLLWFLGLIAPGQDAVTVNPQIAKVEFENDDIRVVRLHYGPHEKIGMHEHPARLAVCVAGGFERVSYADGTVSELHPAAGDFFWSEPRRYAVENGSDEPLEFVEVELKHAKTPGVPVAVKPQPEFAEAPKDPIPVQLEPHHHPRFENQYVRVLEVLIPPGVATFFHKHIYDSVAIVIANGASQNQVFGKDWDAAGPMAAGRVRFTPDSREPRQHRLKNVGDATLRIIDLEVLR